MRRTRTAPQVFRKHCGSLLYLPGRVIRQHSQTARIAFPRPYTVAVIGKIYFFCVLSIKRSYIQATAAPTQSCCVFPILRVPRRIVRYGSAVIVRQQIAPCAVRIPVGFAGFEHKPSLVDLGYHLQFILHILISVLE